MSRFPASRSWIDTGLIGWPGPADTGPAVPAVPAGPDAASAAAVVGVAAAAAVCEFDRGDVLLREPYDIRNDETLESLTQELSTKGGMLLRRILEEKIYDTSSATHTVLEPQLPYSYAKKVQSSERQILWNQFSAFDLYRREKTLGPLYTFKKFVPKKKSKASSNCLKRVVLSACSPTTTPLLETDISLPNGTFRVGENDQLEVKVHDGFVSYSDVKTEGYGAENGTKFLNSLKKKFGTVDAKFTTVLD
ncbi:hypothetical protein PMKS-001739 [Pichia membranifaciens]|uniref:Uncharacterized protein n=1 Tax=Pichia membranifaciens TaxID=4926 RepID=A0A1Q2YFF8_9ASCO|nr:hypothetical protein PMKS-001739 [Pichia membranifaciens]